MEYSIEEQILKLTFKLDTVKKARIAQQAQIELNQKASDLNPSDKVFKTQLELLNYDFDNLLDDLLEIVKLAINDKNKLLAEMLLSFESGEVKISNLDLSSLESHTVLAYVNFIKYNQTSNIYLLSLFEDKAEVVQELKSCLIEEQNK